MNSLETFKFFLTTHTGLAKDALHNLLALGVYLGAYLMFGWRTAQWKPWLLVAAAAITGEVWDLYDIMHGTNPLRPWAKVHDIWNTMLAPMVLLVLSRYSGIFNAKPAKPAVPSKVKSGNQP